MEIRIKVIAENISTKKAGHVNNFFHLGGRER